MTTNDTISSRIAHHCTTIDYDQLDRNVVDRAKYLLLDFLGCAIRGSQTESCISALGALSSHSAVPDPIPVIGTDERLEASFAALVMGIAAHSIELDDVVNRPSLHPAVSIIPTALSICCRERLGGKELIAALVVGYELMVKLGIAVDPSAHYGRGFHPTGTCGTFGAALTAAKLMRLDATQIRNALGIAGSQAAGSLEFLTDGAYTKRFHAGWACHSGIISASLAGNGFTGPATIIEGKFGFLNSYSDNAHAPAVLENWGEPFEVLNTSIKPHACCRYKQGAIDCIAALVRENRLHSHDIRKIRVAVLDAGFALVAEPIEQKRDPHSIVDAQFSMPFGAAVAVVYGDAFINRYSEEEIERPEIQELMQKVECLRDADLNEKFPAQWPARVEMELYDGTIHKKELTYPKGDPENPLSWDELTEKFTALGSSVFDKVKCMEIRERVRSIEHEDDIQSFMAQLMSGD